MPSATAAVAVTTIAAVRRARTVLDLDLVRRGGRSASSRCSRPLARSADGVVWLTARATAGAATLADEGAGAVVLTSLDVAEAETRLIERALEVSGGNRTRAAELLGISVRTLRNKLNGPGREPATT